MSLAPCGDVLQRAFLVLIGLGAGLACGGGTRATSLQDSGLAEGTANDSGPVPDDSGSVPDDSGPVPDSDNQESSNTTGAGATFLLAAQRESDWLLVSLDAVTATLQTFGVPVAQSPDGISRLNAAPDLSRAILVVGPEECCTGALGNYRTVAADDQGSRVLGAGNGCGSSVVSNDAALAWLSIVQDDAGNCTPQGAALLKFDGSAVYKTPPPPSDQDPVLGGFSPDGGWFLYLHDGVLARRTLDGQENVIRSVPQDPSIAQQPGVLHLWPTSILLDGTYPALALVDTSGAPISIPGFTPDATLVLANAADGNVYYASGGTLYRLDDRVLVPIQDVPASFDVQQVIGTTPGKILVAQTDAKNWVATKADGQALATFTLPTVTVPQPPSGAPVSTTVSVDEVVLTDERSAVLFRVQYDAAVAADLDVALAFYRELWTFDQNGSSSILTFAEFLNDAGTNPVSLNADSFEISTAADYVAHVTASNHALSVIDTKSGLSRAVSSDLSFSGVMAARR